MMLFPKKSPFPLLWCASSLLVKSASSFTAPTAPQIRSRFVTTTTTMSAAASHSFQGKTVVSIPDAIQAHSSSTNVKFVDGSWFLAGRNARDEFEQGPRILGSHYFDIDDIATPSSADNNLMHMMPTKELFAAAMDSMGISNQDHVIVYGSKDCLFLHRAWFQMRNMGHDKDFIHMLHGSLADWQTQGGPMETEGSSPTNPIVNAKDLDTSKPTTYQATDAQNIVDKEELLELIAKQQQGKEDEDVDAIWIDARAPERFRGEVEEPRAGMRLGHMPFAKNIFFKDLLNPENVLEFKPKEELEQILRAGGVDLSTTKRIICTCGSGATACALVAALELVGIPPERCYLYDASWAEWGALPDTPIVKEEVDTAKRQKVEK